VTPTGAAALVFLARGFAVLALVVVFLVVEAFLAAAAFGFFGAAFLVAVALGLTSFVSFWKRISNDNMCA